MKMSCTDVTKVILLATLITAAYISAEDIEYPGDLVRFGQNVSTEGVVIRVLNSTYHDPPILVSWKHANYSVAWQYPEDLELIEISSAVPFEEQLNDCMQMHSSPGDYENHLSDRVRVGMLFRSLINDENFWPGDVCIYLGDDGFKYPLKKFWCFRSKKLVTVDSFVDLQILGVRNYPGVYEYSDRNQLKGYYRYPVLNKYEATIRHKNIFLGDENTAVLTLNCNNGIDVTPIVYTSLMHNSNYTDLTNSTIPVPHVKNLTTTWTALYLGENYLEFLITESGSKYVKTGVWYNVLETVTHDIMIEAPGTDDRFIQAIDPITITHVSTMDTTAFLACLYFNGSYSNESQFDIVEADEQVIVLVYEQRGTHDLFSMVWNKLSLEITVLSISVIQAFEIGSVTITTDSYVTASFLPDLKFYVRAPSGYGYLCNIFYDDGEYSTHETTMVDFYNAIENSTDLDTAIKTDPGIQHNFTKPSAYSDPGVYQVQVVCENAISFASNSTTMTVQHEIVGFSAFSIPLHEYGAPIDIVWQLSIGTNVTVEIWYNDLLCDNRTDISTTNDQNNSRVCLVTDPAHFDSDRSVDIKLSASNLVSYADITVTVEMFYPMNITKFVALTTIAQWGANAQGAGPIKNKFPAEHPVLFEVEYTGGPASEHGWTFFHPHAHVYCTNCGSRSSTDAEGKFEFSVTDDTFDAEFKLWNTAGETKSVLAIDLDRSFRLTSVLIDSPVTMNRTETLTVNLEDIGAHTCIAIDFGDNSLLRLYGSAQACDEQYDHTSRSDVIFTEKPLNTTQIDVEHAFETTGTYQVKLDGRNYVSWNNFQQEVVVALAPCEYPNVTITGLNESIIGAVPEHMKSEELTLTTINDIDCELTELTKSKWNISKLDRDPTPRLSEIDSVPRTEYQFSIPTDLNLSELVLQSRSLEYGFYAVTVRLEMDGHPDIFAEDTKYFYVVATPFLEPAVTTGFMYSVLFREVATLNASITRDPDFEDLNGVNFEWFCRDMDDTVEFGPDYHLEPLRHVPVVNETFPPAEMDSIGCFGEGRGRLNVTSPILEMDSTFMVEGKYFMITLVVSKVDPVFGLRRSATDIYFQVIFGLPPSLEVNCRKNCQEKVNPEEKLIVEATCVARCYGELEFKWTLYTYDSVDQPEPFWLTSLTNISSEVLGTMVTNPIDELNMAFKPNVMEPNKKYILQLIAQRPNGVYGELRYTILTNEAPKGGECSVFPPVGVAMTTIFNFTCKNWNDTDHPIKYEYSYEIDGIRTVFLTTTSNPSSTVISSSELPIGDPNRGNDVNIYVNIRDKYEGATELNFTIKVEPPLKEDINLASLDDMVSGSGSMLDDLVTNGDPQKALALAAVVSSVLNHVDPQAGNTTGNLTDEEISKSREESQKIDKMRQNIMKSLTGINITDMNTLLQLSGTTQALTQNAMSLSPETQDYGVQLCNASVAGLDKLSEGETPFKNVKSAVNNLASTLGQLITAAAEPREEDNFTISDAGADRAKASISMTDNLHEATLRYLVVNEGATTSTTKHMSLQSEKVSITKMGKNGNAASDCGFKTPSPEVFGFGDIVKDVNATISQLDTVTIKMGVFNKNPYTWDNTSKTVTSKIASLDLNSSRAIQLSNLTEDIAITISRDPSQFPKIASFYMKPDKHDPNFDGKMYLKYHCFNRTSRWTAMNFEIFPEDVSLNLKVYLKTGGKPDVRKGDFNLQYDLPDFSSCEVNEHNTTTENETIVIDPFNHCAIHPYSLFVSNIDFNTTGEHCFAIQIKNGTMKDANLDPAKTRRKRSFACDIGKRRMRRSCVIIPPPPPPPPTESPIQVLVADNLGFDGQYFFPNQTPNYNMSMYESSCLYWDEDNQTWTGHGCRVGPLTTRSNIQCFCNHLTSFGSDLVVAPNPIDFNSVFNNFGSLQDNVAVLALISTVLGLYILGVLWGRRADKRDKLMIGPTIIPNPEGTYHYLVTLYTGNRQGSGTTAKVFFKMAGDNDETLPVKMWDSKRPCYERGQENQFIVSYPREVGELSFVQIWHNNAGLHPSWYLSRLTVKDIQTNKQWFFVCDNWLAVESEDGKVCRVLPVANEQELTNFNQLFTARTVKGLADGHLWFSIFSRPPNSNFTRVQRLSCCLCLLCCTMITSAMFFNMGGDGPSRFAIHIGSLVIDLKQFVIALQSSLIIVPVNVAIVQIFRNLKPKQSKEEKYSKEQDEDERQDEENEESKPKGKLPYWFIYVAYALCYLASAASIFFTLLYSIQWGKEKSTEWVIAMVTAFLQSVLLLQPVKVLVLAVVFAVLVRKPTDVEENDDSPVIYEPPSPETLQKKRKKTGRMKVYTPPDPETLKEARAKRLKEIKMNNVIKEIAAFFIFLIMLLNVAYYHRNPNTFLMTKTLFETFDEVDAWGIDLGAVSDGDSLWMWTRETLIPGLYANEWYNGKKAEKGFIANMEDYLVGVPRIRLARVEEDSCTVDKLFEDSIPHCYDAFSYTTEDDETYDVSWEPLSTNSARKRRHVQDIPETEEEWLDMMARSQSKKEQSGTRHGLPVEYTLEEDSLSWKLLPRNTLAKPQKGTNEDTSRQRRAIDPIASSATGKNRRKKKRLLGSSKPKVYAINDAALLPNGKIMSCLERWEYQSMMDLRGFPYWGAISLYSGGGYAANLGYDSVTAYTVISDLHSNSWIDIQTRAVFVEFTVYNANTNLFGIVSIMVEFPSSSAAFTKVQYQSARFYLHLNSAETLSHVLVIFFMLYFLYREGKLVYKQRCAYFKGFWNWVETILVVCEFMTIILFLARLYEVDKNLIQLRENPNDYVPFQYAASADAALCYILGILVFFYTIRFLRLLRFNKNFAVLGKTLSRMSGPILGFCIPFFFGFLAFGLFAFAVFGTELQDYSTFKMTLVTQFSMTLGDFDFEALVMTNPLIGPMYFFAFVGMNVFILMNVFLAIINDTYAEVQEEESNTQNEYEILEYIAEQIQMRVKGDSTKKRKTRKVRPKKEKVPIEKPHYVTFRESNMKYKTLYDTLFVEELKNENTNSDSAKENHANREAWPLSESSGREENVPKLDKCGEELDNLLERLQEGESNEIQTLEAIGGVSDEKRHDICYRVLVFIETAA